MNCRTFTFYNGTGKDDSDIKKIFEITMSPRLQQKRKIHLEIRVAIIQKYAPYQQQ